MKPETNSFYRYFPISRRDKNWGLYITTAGEARITSHATYPPSGHPTGYAFDWQHGRTLDSYALVYISSGQGTFEWKPDFSTTIGRPGIPLISRRLASLRPKSQSWLARILDWF